MTTSTEVPCPAEVTSDDVPCPGGVTSDNTPCPAAEVAPGDILCPDDQDGGDPRTSAYTKTQELLSSDEIDRENLVRGIR